MVSKLFLFLSLLYHLQNESPSLSHRKRFLPKNSTNALVPVEPSSIRLYSERIRIITILSTPNGNSSTSIRHLIAYQPLFLSVIFFPFSLPFYYPFTSCLIWLLFAPFHLPSPHLGAYLPRALHSPKIHLHLDHQFLPTELRAHRPTLYTCTQAPLELKPLVSLPGQP